MQNCKITKLQNCKIQKSEISKTLGRWFLICAVFKSPDWSHVAGFLHSGRQAEPWPANCVPTHNFLSVRHRNTQADSVDSSVSCQLSLPTRRRLSQRPPRPNIKHIVLISKSSLISLSLSLIADT